MYKIVNGNAPSYLSDLVPNLVQDRAGYMLRNRGNIDVPFARLNVYANSFFPAVIKLWNDLPSQKKSLPSIEAFKADHKRSLPKKNPLYYFGGRLEAAIHARMRIDNSPLKAHLFNHLHVVEDPLCSCTMGVNETPKHFFFEYPKFDNLRITLNTDLLPFIVDNVDHLLFGLPNADHLINLHVFAAVHKYIRSSKRFY
jgi:hypothetical protein